MALISFPRLRNYRFYLKTVKKKKEVKLYSDSYNLLTLETSCNISYQQLLRLRKKNRPRGTL